MYWRREIDAVDGVVGFEVGFEVCVGCVDVDSGSCCVAIVVLESSMEV